jgi:hypothetical protein
MQILCRDKDDICTGKDTLAKLNLRALRDKKMNCFLPYSPFPKVCFWTSYLG